MKILIWAECKKLRRSNIVFLTVFAVVMITVILFIGGKSIDSGFQGMDDPGWYMMRGSAMGNLVCPSGSHCSFGKLYDMQGGTGRYRKSAQAYSCQ